MKKPTTDIKGTEFEQLLNQLPHTYPQMVQRTNKPGKDIKMTRQMWQALMTAYPVILEATLKADRLKASLIYEAKLKEFAHPAFPEPKRKLKPNELELLHAILGLISEGGELLEMFMSRVQSGLPIDRVNAVEELGDAAWFLQAGLRSVTSRLEEAQQINQLKLLERFPDGYSDIMGLVRDQEKERKVMEQNLTRNK